MFRWGAKVGFMALAWWVPPRYAKRPCADLRQTIGHEADLGPSIRRDRARAPMREVLPLGPCTTIHRQPYRLSIASDGIAAGPCISWCGYFCCIEFHNDLAWFRFAGIQRRRFTSVTASLALLICALIRGTRVFHLFRVTGLHCICNYAPACARHDCPNKKRELQ